MKFLYGFQCVQQHASIAQQYMDVLECNQYLYRFTYILQNGARKEKSIIYMCPDTNVGK